jgi:hypothetical protein
VSGGIRTAAMGELAKGHSLQGCTREFVLS